MKFIILGLNLLFDEFCKFRDLLNDEFSFMTQINIFRTFFILGVFVDFDFLASSSRARD